MNKTYCGLLKLGQKEHIESLYETGCLYLNTFDYFRKLETGNQDGRADKYEYISCYHCGPAMDGIRVAITAKKQDGTMMTFPLSREGGLQSIVIDSCDKKYTHLFCMSLIDIEWIKEHKTIIDKQNVAEGKDWILIINNVQEFFNRIKVALDQKGWDAESRAIEYIDSENFSGEMGCFKKFKSFEHQQEWRLAVSCPETHKAQILEIGSLKDIASKPCLAEEIFAGDVTIVENV